MKKLSFSVDPTLILICFGVCMATLTLFDRRESRAKVGESPPGYGEMYFAMDFVNTNESPGFGGNTPDAEDLAEHFSSGLSASGQRESPPGRFQTYCFLQKDTIAILVRMPEMKTYEEARILATEEFAWKLGTSRAASKHPAVTKLAIGILGEREKDIWCILTGEVKVEKPAHKVVVSRYASYDASYDRKDIVFVSDQLLPFFLPPP